MAAIADPNSMLYRGPVTSNVDPNYTGVWTNPLAPKPKKKEDNSNLLLYIGAGVGALVGVMGLAACSSFVLKRRRQAKFRRQSITMTNINADLPAYT